MTTPAQPESKTPRTDAEVVCVEHHGYSEFDQGWFVNADFARQLETELTTAQQRIKELEQDKSIVAWIEKASHRDILSLNACLFPSAEWDKQFGQEPEGRKRLRTRIIAAMSREPKEGEAK